VKDAALQAIERAAKAVLKDYLKALRAKHREELASVNRDVARLMAEVEPLKSRANSLKALVDTMKERDRRLMRWIDRNRGAGDVALKCIGEYLMHPTGIDNNCTNTAGLCSFARWGLENP
jgi:ketosteroid isomerase-like protein